MRKKTIEFYIIIVSCYFYQHSTSFFFHPTILFVCISIDSFNLQIFGISFRSSRILFKKLFFCSSFSAINLLFLYLCNKWNLCLHMHACASIWIQMVAHKSGGLHLRILMLWFLSKICKFANWFLIKCLFIKWPREQNQTNIGFYD